MKAAGNFRAALLQQPAANQVARIVVRLFGSLAWTGKGHAVDKAIVLGLSGYRPDTIDPDEAESDFAALKTSRRMQLSQTRQIEFVCEIDIVFDFVRTLPGHPNALTFYGFRSRWSPNI